METHKYHNMKNSIIIFILAVFFAACSDDNSPETPIVDPFLPIANLEIPTQQLTGTDITIQGQGFAEGCSIVLQHNDGQRFETEIVERAEDHIVIRPAQSLAAGFYIVVLQQNDQEYRIGAINIYLDELLESAIEVYAIADDGSGLGIYPASITQQILGEKLVSINSDANYYGALAIGSTIYYATFLVESIIDDAGIFWGISYRYSLYGYDIETAAEPQTLFSDRQMVAMGEIDGSLHVIFYNADVTPQTYSLEKWNGTSFEEVKTFPAGGGDLLEINGGTFVYDESTNTIFMGMRDMSGDTESAAWYFNLTQGTEMVKTGSTSDVNYFFLKCGSDICVTGYRNIAGEDEDEYYEAYIFQPEDLCNWNFNAMDKTVLDNAMFTDPVYDANKNLIYGLNADETVVSFDIATQSLTGGIWVNSGIYGIIPISQNN